jgi:hypothetical protein
MQQSLNLAQTGWIHATGYPKSKSCSLPHLAIFQSPKIGQNPKSPNHPAQILPYPSFLGDGIH